ncbi:unnamed protein product [Durusdinium trenchii]|uniref:Uncharacterized protein n=2 Tax=Durusdinium trenchii TaxID=1381693 RepID=A0ABP0P550_9DINO
MAKPVKPAAWQVAQEPQALSLPAFRQWQRRIARHRQHLIAAKEVTDISQYEREVQELERASAAHKSSRKAQKREEEAKLKKDNVRLVQKLCDVARQSEKRQEAISARSDPAGASVLKFKPQRMKRQQAIFADNLALLHRLETVRSVVPSASQAVESHSRHRAIAARLSRSRRPVGMARPVPPPGRPSGPRLRRGPGAAEPEQSRMAVLPKVPPEVPELPEVTFSEVEAGARRVPLHLAEAEAVLLLPALEDREDLSRMLPITYNEHGMGTASPVKEKDTSDAGSEFPEDFEDPSDSESER